MSTAELEQLITQYQQQEFHIMKELLNRNVGNQVTDDLQPADMIPTEEDF